MIKSIAIGINLLAVLLFAMLQKSEVSISHDVPTALKPGQEQVVTVVIEKSNVAGFAKYQVTVGPGLKVEAVETAGASFTFNEQKAKFIWMALPTVKKFELKYRLVAAADAVAPSPLDSRFSYVFDNERKNYDLPSGTVSFGSDVEATEEVIAVAAQQAIGVSGSRSISNAGINQWRVDVTITKTGIEGFAKLEETIPQGFTAIDLKSNNAVFALEEKSVKYIWYDFPDKESVVVSYKLMPVVAMDGKEPAIDGSFAYLSGGETKTIAIGESYIEPMLAMKDTTAADSASGEMMPLAENKESEIAEEEIIERKEPIVEEAMESPLADLPEEKQAPTPIPTPTPKPAPAPATQATTKPAAVQPSQAPENNVTAKANTDGNIVNVPQPEKGVFYRVQIAAGPNNLNRDQFSKLYAFSEDLKLESHSGLLKYTTGYHQVYKSARDSRVRITEKYAKFKGPFVTAYNDGDRITVQEALMITNQKWFQ